MNSERIKEIQYETAYPESRSVKLALDQVWNECSQEHNKVIESWKEEEKIWIKQLAEKDAEIEMLKNKSELVQEDLECVHLFLDEIRAPRKDDGGNIYSILGRINNSLIAEITRLNNMVKLWVKK